MQPKPLREFQIPGDVLEEARQLGIESAGDFQRMLRLSARITHPNGNRRYEDFLFKVEGWIVTEVGRVSDAPAPSYRCKDCKDTGKIQVFNQCPRCEGFGCDACDQGLYAATVPCKACSRIRS